MVMKNIPEKTSEQGTVLKAFLRALSRESHVLTHQPELLWQQLYNRLQWLEGPVAELAAAEWESRSSQGVRPWVCTKTPFRESEDLLRTLSGHTHRVTACAFSPDGDWIVSASGDETLKVWDAASGRELRTLSGHTDRVNACAFSPDGKMIVSASEDNTLKVWDAASGRARLSIPLLGSIIAVDLNHWKASVVCGDTGSNVYILDLVGVTYGPIIVTVHQDGQNLVFQCPACQQEHAISQEQLGSEMTCPTADCGLQLKLNTFVIKCA
jgi:WD40 repeat protein